MKKIFLLFLLCGFNLLGLFAVSETERNNVSKDWKAATAQAKITMLGSLQKNGKIVASPVMRPGNDLYKIIADVSGWDNLILVTYCTEDGKNDDFGSWLNARLIDSSGKATLVKDLRKLAGEGEYGVINYGAHPNYRVKKIEFNGKEPEETITAVGNSLMVIPLNKKFVRFESEVGVDDSSKKGSVVFRALAISDYPHSKALIEDYPNELLIFSSFAKDDFRAMLLQDNAIIERNLAVNAIKRVNKQIYLKEFLQQVDDEKNLYAKISGYLDIFEKATRIADLQTHLEWLNVKSVEASMNEMQKFSGFDKEKNEKSFIELSKLANGGFEGIYVYDSQSLKNAEKALSLKREILMNNPLLDVDELIVGCYKLGNNGRHSTPPNMGTPPNNWSNQTSAKRDGFNASIEALSNLRGNITSRLIFKPSNSVSVPDMKLHWDAERLLFSMPESGNHHWQIYEVKKDGSNLKQITHGTPEDLDYFDATYLPNGKIIAASNVGGQGVPCVSGSDQVGNLCIIDPENRDMRRLTFDQDANWGPVVMNNGRIMYVRWEYTDLTHYFSRIVMHMNPDGTEQRSLYGSGSVFPTSIYDVQPLPDHPTRFVGIISGHHGTQRSGRLIIFDPAKSRKEEKGMIQELPFSKRPITPIIKDQMVDGVWPQFLKPQPLNKDYYIVTAKLTPNSLWGIYLVDVFDNLTLIKEAEGEGYIYGIPTIKRKVPPVIPEKINLKSQEATVFIQDIYEGEGLPNVPRGTVKELRVFAYEYAYLRTKSDHTAQGIQSGWDIKRLLGTVPVEEDGSVMFKIPANTPISLQPLDSEGRAIQWMRSWLTSQPGETVSCVGCHEDQNQIPMPKRVIASLKEPQLLKKPEGGVRSFTFDLEIQPILDRNCISCHNGGESKLNYLAGRKDKNGFGLSYLDLHPYVHRQGPEAGMKVLYPYEYHASVSPLVRMLKDGHYGVELTDKEWRTLYNWIDFNAPDKGSFDAVDLNNNDRNQINRRITLNKKYANGIFADWKQELTDYASYLKENPTDKTLRKEFIPTKFKDVKLKTASINNNEFSIERKNIEIAPGVVVTFVKVPAGKFVMGKNQQNKSFAPAHIANVKKSFWMSEKEITNGQYGIYYPEHNSRFVDQQWKDHVTEGYKAYLPEQPVIRVSMKDALDFCRKVGEFTGLNITLPSELQWERACRGGSKDDFWYGTINSDFAMYENMSDKQMNKMAVSGVDPKPMKDTDDWYKYYTFHPKIESVDDGHMIMAIPGSYKPNQYGLYDMHGNVAEWTKSDFTPYPYSEKKQGRSELKVVRGGSWKDHPKDASAVSRKGYYPHQKVHNVGFRIIIEE